MTVENIKFILENLHDLATLTATTEDGTLVVENTQSHKRSRVWRSTAILSQVITGTMPSGYRADTAVIHGHNLSPAASVRLVLKLGGSGGTTEYDSGATTIGTLIPLGVFRFGIDPWGGEFDEGGNVASYTFSFDGVNFDYYELTISDAGNTDGYLQVRQIFIGAAWQPPYTFDNGISLTYVDGIEQNRTDAGSLHAEGLAETYRVLEFDMSFLDDATRTAIISKMARASRSRVLWVSCYPGDGGQREREYQMVCMRTNNLRIMHKNRTRWATRLRLEEV